MIVKRRQTKQFVQIANEIVRDRSIPLDAHGMLHYLLSLPDDWEVNLRQIEKFWSIGSTKRQRIFRDLVDAGWLQYEKLKDDDGNYVGSRWVVCDEPGPRPSTNEIEAIEEDGEPLAATKSDPAPESQAPDGSASQGDRERSLPGDGPPGGRKTRLTENPPVEARRKTLDENRDSTNTTAEAARDDFDDGEPPPSFGQLLKLWPADNVASPYACERAFGRMTPWDRRQAREKIPTYLADCRTKGQNRICDLRTYLDERRWERFTSRSIGPSRYDCKRGTPQAMRWREHYGRTAPERIRLFDTLMATSGHYTTESEWPPPRGPQQAGTPQDGLSDEDAHELAKL